MNRSLQQVLFAIVASLIAVDIVWGWLGHFQVDVRAYVPAGLLGLALLGGGIFYQTRRRDPQLAAMILGTSFLVLFSASANLLNNYLLTVAGSRIDAELDAVDRALGFDWYRLMLGMADHPALTGWLFRIYNIALPEVALLLVVLAWSGKTDKAYRFCLSVAIGALIAIGLWAIHPAFGAMSLYTLPPDVAGKLMLTLTCEFGKAQVALLRDGPGFITLDALHGSLIGFPSYHAVLALLIMWYGRTIRYLRWPLVVLNIGVIVSTPIQGGHHLIDVLGAGPVTVVTLLVVSRLARGESEAKAAGMVNEAPRNNNEWVSTRPFCSGLKQKAESRPVAIKAKLKALP
jgi:hypothetical protein